MLAGSHVRKSIRARLATKLTEALGFEVKADDLTAAQGAYRTGNGDYFRWEAARHSIASWSTMTNCLRKGFNVTTGKTCAGTRNQIDAKD